MPIWLANAGLRSLKRLARRSAVARVRVNTSTVGCMASSLSNRLANASPWPPIPAKGIHSMSRRGGVPSFTACASNGRPLPARNRPATPWGRQVADRPYRSSLFPVISCSRSNESERSAPRLQLASACTSSTTTILVFASRARIAGWQSQMANDSGVTIQRAGGFLRSRRRIPAGVSALRELTVKC